MLRRVSNLQGKNINMLIISDQDVRELLSTAECVPVMETCFREYGSGIAKSTPRNRYGLSLDGEVNYYSNVLTGAVPAFKTAAVRIDSNHRYDRYDDETGTPTRIEFIKADARDYGIVLLFSIETCALLAIIQGFWLSAVRVGATTGVAVDQLAISGTVRVGQFGTGKQARTNLAGICAVRDVSEVKVFSPNPEHRKEFATDMSDQLGVDIVPVSSAREVVDGVHIVSSATSASSPVFDGKWLEPGQLVTSIANADVLHPGRMEVDETTLDRADTIVINDLASVKANLQVELDKPLADEKVYELGSVLTGASPGRQTDDQIIYYKSNVGLGIQFAAAGAIVYEKALARGMGHAVPDDMFFTDLTSWYQKGFFPSA